MGLSFHAALAFPLLLDQVALGIWSLVLGFRRQAVGSALVSALIVDEGLLVLQSIIGGAILLTGRRPDTLHFLYGGLLLGLLPVVYPYTRRQPQRAGIWLGLTLLFMAGLIVRTYLTGRA